MKRKITKIGTLLASVALLFGATSWASAQSVTITFSPNADCTGFESKIEGDGASAVEASFTKGGKLSDLVKVTDKKSQTDFVALKPTEKLSNTSNCIDFKISVKDEGYAFTITKVSYEAVKTGTDAKGKDHGIYQQIAADSKKFWEGHVKANDIHRDTYDGSDANHQDDGVGLGHEIEKSATCAHTCDVYLGPGDNIDAGKGVGIREIKIEGTVVKRVKVAYIAANANVEGKHIHPVYDALASDSAFITELVVKDADVALDPADFVDKYDVVLLGGNASGKGKQAVSFPQLAAKIPLLNVTKAFAYGKTSEPRSGWGVNASGIKGTDNNYVNREKKYRTHPVFDGLQDSIVVFADCATHLGTNASTWHSVMQGYPTLSAVAPAHTLLGTSGVGDALPLVNSVAEAWVKNEAGTDSIPYMIVAYDNDIIAKTDSMMQLTADGARLYKNAVRYLDSARVQYIPPIIGECPTPTVTFKQVISKADGGNKESDTLRWVLNITVDKVFKDMKKVEAEKVAPTVTVTIGDGAAHPYNAEKPDTLWEPCNVKVLVESNFYTETVKTVEFKNEGLRKLPDPKPVYTVIDKDNDPRHLLTFEIAKVSLDGKDTIPTIKYSLDGSDNLALTYDDKKPDTLGLDATVKAQAQLYLYLPSDLVSENWHNPYAKQVDKPEITFVPDPAYPDGCVQLVTITTATEGATIYYTPDGQEANEHSWRYQAPFPITNFNDVPLQAIAMRDGWAASDRAYDTIPASTSKPLAVPEIKVTGNSFEITGDTRGAIYYTMDGTEPSETNGIKYTQKVTYSGTDTTYRLIAKGQGYGYRASEANDTAEFAVGADKALVFEKVIYRSTFNREDPSVRHDEPEIPNLQTWGWFRWNEDAEGNITLAGEKPQEDRNASKYITNEEWADGIYYDGESKGPRAQIFLSGSASEWRGFNNWVFWKENTNRRMLVQNHDVATATIAKDATVSTGALLIFNDSHKAVAGPDSTFKGPFAVKVNVSNGNNGKEFNAGSLGICITDAAEASNEVQIGKIEWASGDFGHDTIYYYGDEEVYVHLTTTDANTNIFDFIVYGEGAALPPLVTTQVPWGTQEAPATVGRGTKEFTVTFNNDVTISVPNSPFCWTVVNGDFETQIPCTLKPGATAKEVVITLNEAISAADGTLYYLGLPKNAVTDGDGQKNAAVNGYIKVEGEAGIDEVNAAKEVVATYIYSISGAQMNALTPGVNIVKTVYSDGTTTTEKIQVVK